MASDRFPVIEVMDLLRQLWYVRPDYCRDGRADCPLEDMISPWGLLSASNPYWQLKQRQRYSLNLAPDMRYPLAVWRPPIPESEDNEQLRPPVLYDNVNEFGIAATTSPAEITGVVVQYRDSNPTGLFDPLADVNIRQTAVYEAFLFVMNQDAPQSRLLRYMNWFNWQPNKFQQDQVEGLAVGEATNPFADKVKRLIGTGTGNVANIRFSDPVKPTLGGPFSEINRQASMGILIEARLLILNEDSDLTVTSSENIFDIDEDDGRPDTRDP